ADLRFALRSLAKARGFTLAVLLTLGLGIGANTAIFSVVRGVLLRPLPHRDGDRLVYLRQSVEGPGGENVLFSVPEILDFRENARSLAGIAEYSGMVYTLQGDEDAVRMTVGLVTGNYFQVMGLSPVLGRLLTDDDDGTGVPPVIVLTHEYWMNRFHGDSGVVGQTIRVDGQAVQVVGVVQPAPYFPTRMDALMNMVISEHHTSALMVHGRTHRMTEMVARLAPGATVEEARAEVATIRSRVQADHPDAYDAASGYKVTLTPFQEVLGEQARLTLWLLMGAAAFVLVISCANVANLTLMRGVRREHELVVRAALGAGTARLRRLLLVENLVLATGGALLGVVMATAGLKLLIAFAARVSPRAGEIRLDGMVLGFTMLLTVVVALLLAYAPRLAREGSLGTWISQGVARASGSLRRQRLQRALVVAQIAVSVILLTAAGLLTRTMQRLSEVDTGLTADEVLTMEVPISGGGRSDADTKALYDRMKYELAGLPGVHTVGVGSVIPLRLAGFQLEVKAEGRALAAGEAMPRAEFRTASPEYFRAAGIPLLAGREFTSTDMEGSGLVVILNETLAKRLFGDRDPIGQRVAWTGDVLRFIPVSGDWRTVVGVVGDTKDGGLDAEAHPALFQPFAQEQVFSGGLVIRADRDAAGLAPAATRMVRSIAPQDPIENVLTFAEIKDQSVAPRRLNASLVGAFGILAVVIAAVGIAGVLAFSVSARTNEIGIRMSLGADAGRVQRMVISEGGILLALGLVLGVAGALLATRVIQGLLFGVAPHDPVTLGAVALVMLAVGIGACWLPARRAARVDPAVAMRGQ
ncbi:MAG: ABC transporter permease, partial [Gemmatimonadales bacterium]|nr:ABC transporter permease [Gemmatimonadales bacterium]